MNPKPTATPSKLAGITSFSDDNSGYIAPPPREVREQARADAAEIGFVSDKPTTAPKPITKKRTRQPSQYPDHYNLRLREGDRERFDEYAYRNRIPKGEAFRIMLDLAEADEQHQKDVKQQ